MRRFAWGRHELDWRLSKKKTMRVEHKWAPHSFFPHSFFSSRFGAGGGRARDRKVRRSLGIRLLNGIMQTQPPSLHWYITVHTCFSGKKKGQPRSALITRSASAGSGLIALPHPKPGTKHEKKDERVNYVRMAPCTPRARHTPARRRHASSLALGDTRRAGRGAPTVLECWTRRRAHHSPALEAQEADEDEGERVAGWRDCAARGGRPMDVTYSSASWAKRSSTGIGRGRCSRARRGRRRGRARRSTRPP